MSSAPTPALSPIEWHQYDPSLIVFPSWLVENLIPEGSTCCLYGPPNVGKTFLTLDMALCIATGRPWLDLKTRPFPESFPLRKKVVYVLAENPQSLHRRIAGWFQHHQVDVQEGRKELFGCFHIPLIEGRFLDRPEHLDEVILEIERVCPDVSLIVFDPLISFMEGEENNARSAQFFIHALRRIVDRFKGNRCSVLVVHHSGKDASRNERGSSALRGGIDTLIQVLSDRIRMEKQRDAAKAEDIPIEFLTIESGSADQPGPDYGRIAARRVPEPPTDQRENGGRAPSSKRKQAKGARNAENKRIRRERILQAFMKITGGDTKMVVKTSQLKAELGKSAGSQSTLYSFLPTLAQGENPVLVLVDDGYKLHPNALGTQELNANIEIDFSPVPPDQL